MKLSDYNKKYSLIAGYVIVTCLIVFIIYRIVGNIEVITATVWKAIKWVMALLKPVVIGFVIAYLIYPLMKHLEGLLFKIKPLKNKKKTVRGLAVIILSIIVAIIIALLIMMLVATITRGIRYGQAIDFEKLTVSVAEGYDKIYDELVDRLESVNVSSNSVDKAISAAVDKLGDIVKHITTGMIKGVSNITGIFSTILFSIIFGIYFLLDGENLLKYWKRALKALLNKKQLKTLSEFVRDADRVFSGYIRGQFIDAVLMGVMVTIAFSIVGIKYAPLIGLLTGIGNLVPYLGPFLGYGSTIIVGIATSDYRAMIIACIVLLVIQVVDGNIINPKLLSDQIQIHPLLVVLSLIVGGKIGGIVGMFLAVPCGALIKIWFDKLVAYMEKKKKEMKLAQQAEKQVEKQVENQVEKQAEKHATK